MSKAILTLLTIAAATWACGRQPLIAWPDAGPGAECGCAGLGGQSVDVGVDVGGVGGSTGTSDAAISGTGGTVFVRVPDGGFSPIIRDSGILNGILDAPRDSLLGMLFCGPEVRLGVPCSVSDQVCVLGSLGGVCTCVGGMYLCPLDTSSGPGPCPQGAVTGGFCLSPLSLCLGGGANACFCSVGSYSCF
jgi:hypothetical protein